MDIRNGDIIRITTGSSSQSGWYTSVEIGGRSLTARGLISMPGVVTLAEGPAGKEENLGHFGTRHDPAPSQGNTNFHRVHSVRDCKVVSESEVRRWCAAAGALTGRYVDYYGRWDDKAGNLDFPYLDLVEVWAPEVTWDGGSPSFGRAALRLRNEAAAYSAPLTVERSSWMSPEERDITNQNRAATGLQAPGARDLLARAEMLDLWTVH
jgi:hypothetical protein